MRASKPDAASNSAAISRAALAKLLATATVTTSSPIARTGTNRDARNRNLVLIVPTPSDLP
jgi:hypothetical protein